MLLYLASFAVQQKNLHFKEAEKITTFHCVDVSGILAKTVNRDEIADSTAGACVIGIAASRVKNNPEDKMNQPIEKHALMKRRC